EQRLDALDDGVDVGHVREHVRGRDDVRLSVLCGDSGGRGFGKVILDHRDALTGGDVRGLRRLYPEHFAADVAERLEQGAVVRPDVDHLRVRPGAEQVASSFAEIAEIVAQDA